MLQAKVTHHLVDERICGSIQPPQMVGRGSVCYSGSALQNTRLARNAARLPGRHPHSHTKFMLNSLYFY